MRSITSLVLFAIGNCKFELTASLERSRKWFKSPVQLLLWQASLDAPEEMGCCGSKAAVEAEDPLTGTGICQKQLYPPHISTTGLQVQASTASWIASLPYVEFSSVISEETSMFLAFFESEGSNKSAAAHATASAHKVCVTLP